MAKLVTELGFIIAIPLLAFVVGGQWIDRLVGTKVAFTLAGIPLALGLSTYAIYLKIKKLTK
ncbi:AtpZ/AtpI family protein [Candidatus Berkelbacteria bacterium]|nr:AtpZ/AtpI family protein [Candidatus Berkelbacteria bacterium]